MNYKSFAFVGLNNQKKISEIQVYDSIILHKICFNINCEKITDPLTGDELKRLVKKLCYPDSKDCIGSIWRFEKTVDGEWEPRSSVFIQYIPEYDAHWFLSEETRINMCRFLLEYLDRYIAIPVIVPG